MLMSGVESAFSSFGQARNDYMQGKALKSIYETQGITSLYESELAAKDVALQNKQILGEEKTLYAKAGVDITSGSPLLVMSDTAGKGAVEVNRAKQQGISGYLTSQYYGKVAKISANMSSLSNTIMGTWQTIKTIAMSVAGGATGGVAGAIQGANAAGGGGGGVDWKGFLTSISPSYGYIGKRIDIPKSPYGGGYG